MLWMDAIPHAIARSDVEVVWCPMRHPCTEVVLRKLIHSVGCHQTVANGQVVEKFFFRSWRFWRFHFAFHFSFGNPIGVPVCMPIGVPICVPIGMPIGIPISMSVGV